MQPTSPTWTDAVSALANGVIALTAVAAAIYGAKSLRTWWAQMHGSTEYELARRILTAVYRVRGSIRGVRNPMMSGYEYAGRPGRTPDQPESDIEDVAFAYQQRWNPLQEARLKLDVDLLEAEALWDDALKPAEKALDDCIARLFVTLRVELEHRRKPRQIPSPDRASFILYAGAEDPDQFAEQVALAVKAFDVALKPKLKK